MLRKSFAKFLYLLLLGLVACSPEPTLIPTYTNSDINYPIATGTDIIEVDPPTQEHDTPQVKTTSIPLGVISEDLRGLSLQFWHPWTHDLVNVVESLVDEFNAENDYGINVIASSKGNSLYLDFRTGIGNGSIPNVVAAANNQLHAWDNYGNVIQDLNVYLNDPFWGLKESEIVDFYPVLWEKDDVGGKRYGIPGYTSSSVMAYNHSWAGELGFSTPPTTPTEFKTQACAAAAASVDIAESIPSGGWIANIDPTTVMSWIMAFGGNGINKGGDGYDFDNPEVKAAFDFIKSMFKSGCAWIPENRYSDDEFTSRQGLFYSTGITGFPYLQSSFISNEWGDEWIPIPYPSKDGDAVVNLVGLSYAVIQSTPREQLAAWIFIQWMTQPKNQARIIEASSTFPTRVSTIDVLDGYASENPQWAAALELLPNGFMEPQFGSWEVARWALSDAAAFLVSSSFTTEEIPILLEELNSIMTETHFYNP